jgi:hypothetical protein
MGHLLATLVYCQDFLLCQVTTYVFEGEGHPLI